MDVTKMGGVILGILLIPGAMGQYHHHGSCSPYNCHASCSAWDCRFGFNVFLMWFGMVAVFLTCRVCCRYAYQTSVQEQERLRLPHRIVAEPVIIGNNVGGSGFIRYPYPSNTGGHQNPEYQQFPPTAAPFVIPLGGGGGIDGSRMECPPPEYMPPPAYNDCVINNMDQKGTEPSKKTLDKN